jgi:alpha-glucuronidase
MARVHSVPNLRPRIFKPLSGVALWLALLSISLVRTFAETGYETWLRYPAMSEAERRGYKAFPKLLYFNPESPVLKSAAAELSDAVSRMLGFQFRLTTDAGNEPCIVLASLRNLPDWLPQLSDTRMPHEGGFWLKTVPMKRGAHLVITGSDDREVLYGTFALLRKLALHEPIHNLDQKETPCAPVRFLNHWDNLDGSIERGYAGKSIFWEKNHVTSDFARLRDYARLMASVGINGCSINNVNADVRVLTPELLAQISGLANEFRNWGVRLLLSIDFSSPRKLGGLDTFDPLDPKVAEFWKNKVDEVYRFVPDLAGFILKADSEGRLGPSFYGRTHADAANVIARPLKAHGGLLFYRGFVYDHHMDWRNPKLDRAKAAYDNFKPLDGKFEDNVIVQIKHGPIDFQVREPASPLFGALEHTCQCVELQITQEYTGQQRHLCYLAPMWKEVLDFDLHARGGVTPVKNLVSGRTFRMPTGGFVAVCNVGRDTNWLGHDLALANLYSFGRLAWNPDLSAEKIAGEWTRLTFGHDRLVDRTVVDMELSSWPAYEHYTGPLGIGTLTDILGVHYGPGVESSERNGWGQWHRADERGVGMDRTVATGTGFIGQYSPSVAERFESLQTCPDDLLLFMHHVPYTHVLHSGKSVIQYFYDSHYDGAERAARLVKQWAALKGRIDDERFQSVLQRLQYQAGHALVWRDAVNSWFLKKSGIPDQRGRAGHFPGRIEAETMDLTGYSITDVKPWETASNGKALALPAGTDNGAAHFQFTGKTGHYDLAVQYFDLNGGVAGFDLFIAGQLVDHWVAGDALPSNRPDGHTSTRRTVRALMLQQGDEIRIDGSADGSDRAGLDYVELKPSRNGSR